MCRGGGEYCGCRTAKWGEWERAAGRNCSRKNRTHRPEDSTVDVALPLSKGLPKRTSLYQSAKEWMAPGPHRREPLEDGPLSIEGEQVEEEGRRQDRRESGKEASPGRGQYYGRPATQDGDQRDDK